MQAYLDNSATTRPSERVIEKMTECMREGFYNPSSLYAPAMQAEKRMQACREKLCAKLSAPVGGTVLFTSGGTEANNLAIMGSIAAMHGEKKLIVSAVEHPSVLEAFRALEKNGHTLLYMPVDREGQPDLSWLAENCAEDTALVSCMQVNNETGAMPDIAKLSAIVRENAPKALIHCDCVQGFLRVPPIASLVDMVTVSGHKLHGPKGIGALWLRKGVRVLPRQIGGGQENMLRSGTENTPGIAGLLAAMEDLVVDETLLQKKLRFVEKVREVIPNVIVNGPAPENAAPHIVNLALPGVRAEVMLHALEAENVYCSTGSACSSKKRKLSPVLLAMGIKPDIAEGALRFSLSPHTTQEELDYAAETLGRLYAVLAKYKRR